MECSATAAAQPREAGNGRHAAGDDGAAAGAVGMGRDMGLQPGPLARRWHRTRAPGRGDGTGHRSAPEQGDCCHPPGLCRTPEVPRPCASGAAGLCHGQISKISSSCSPTTTGAGFCSFMVPRSREQPLPRCQTGSQCLVQLWLSRVLWQSNSLLCVPVRRQGSVHLYDLSNTRQAVYCRMR